MDSNLARFFRGRWTAGVKSFKTAQGEVVMGIVMDDEEEKLRAVSRWKPARDMTPDLAETMDRAIREPIEGRPHLPAIVRVADAALAEAIQSARPEVRVEIGPTPSIDDELARLAKDLEGDEHWTWLAPGLDGAAVAPLFPAAAGFLESGLWDVVDPDQLVRMSLAARGLPDVAVHLSAEGSVTGGEVVSVAIAPSRSAVEAWHDDQVPPDEIDVFFYDRDDLPDAAWAELAAHGWASPDAEKYPRIVAGGELERAPTAAELRIAATVMEALGRFVDFEALEKEAESLAFEGSLAREVTLGDGAVVSVAVDPLDLLAGEDDDDEDDGEDALEQLEREVEEDEAFLDLDDEGGWAKAPKASSATVRAPARPGRNDVCWCGSGKKYKKCHLDEDAAKGRG